MIKTDKALKIPDWSKNDINRWADYIELRCLYIEDKLLSKDDVLDFFIDEDMDDLQRGDSNHSYKYDNLIAVIGNYYEIIQYRNRILSNYYPFNIEDGQCISLKSDLTERHLHYIFLLLCSSICFMDKSSMQKITHVFEKYCQPIMKILTPIDSYTGLFGTTRDTLSFKGNLRTRIKQLANCLGAQTTKAMDDDKKYDSINAGDAGLDIISYVKLDDASHIPFALGQCTCSYDKWIDKQHSIDHDTWRARIDPLAPFLKYMYIPFFWHNASGKFEQPTEIHTCLIDRQRIVNILETHDNLFREMDALDLQNLLREIW